MSSLPESSVRLYVAGAIAEAAIVDLRENLFNYSGFPQIYIVGEKDGTFGVTLSWNDSRIEFHLTGDEAKTAVERFRSGAGYERSIFDKVQKALASLEAIVSMSRR